jgi:phosphoenolpyruvate synthase/pyruvate phosphate dikinase
MKWVMLMEKRKLPHLAFLPGLEDLRLRYKHAYYQWQKGLVDVMAEESEVRREQKKLAKQIASDPLWSKKFSRWAKKKLDVAPKFAQRISRYRFERLNNLQLLGYLQKLHEGMREAIKTVIFLAIDTLLQNDLETYLIKHVKDKKELLKVIESITSPVEISANVEQQLDFIKICRECEKKKAITPGIKKDLVKHIEDYGWVAMDSGHGEALTYENLKKELKKQTTTQLAIKEAEIRNDLRRQMQRREDYLKKLKLPARVKGIADYLSQSTFVRTYRRYATSRIAWYSQKFYEEIAKRLDLTMEELVYLTPNEVYAALEEQTSVERLRSLSRQNWKYSIGFLDEKGKMNFWVGEKARKFASKQSTDEETASGDILHGRPVYLGKATGTAKVVMDSSELGKVEDGDILVAMQTPPDYIVVLKKAAGAVVDEGGVTSHASILCRECKVPAIIGTRVATKTYKDGDILTLDSTLGVVERIRHV